MKALTPLALTIALLTASVAPAQSPYCPHTATVESYYNRYLGRHSDPYGMQGYISALRTGSMSPVGVEAAILASPEYYRMQGGSDLQYVTALHRDVLGSPCSDPHAWTARLRHCDRASFVNQMLAMRGVGPAVAPAPVVPAAVVDTYRPHWREPHAVYPRPSYVAPTYVAPAYYAPRYVAPTYVAPRYAAPVYSAPVYAPRPSSAVDVYYNRPNFGIGFSFAR